MQTLAPAVNHSRRAPPARRNTPALPAQDAPSAEQAAARREVVSEFRALWTAGRVPLDARAVLLAHPELRANVQLVLELAYEEFCLRAERGETVDPDSFSERFPSCRVLLRDLLVTHQLYEEAEDLGIGWPQPGETFARFRLLRELGHGAFAHVFLARETGLGQRPVALKVSAFGAGEADILGRLEHPNIVPVYSIHADAVTGLTAVCMPYAGEVTLAQVLHRAFARSEVPRHAQLILEAARDYPADVELQTARHAPAPVLVSGTYVDGICHLGVQLADALAYAHAHGVFHRDLKPSNVLLTPDGTPLLLDFNLAFDAQQTDWRLGGTIPYMAPEHLRATDPVAPGAAAAVDARSDIFSLGVILYQLLTGVHPFGELSAEDSAQQLRTQLLERQPAGPARLDLANPHVDTPLARIVERCLAFDPRDRPQSAAELATALRQSLSPWRRARRWLASQVRNAVGLLVLLLAASVAVGYAVATRPAPHVRPWQDGVQAYGQRHFANAAELFSQALAEHPENAWLWFARGRARYQQALRGAVTEKETITLLEKALVDFEEAERRTQDGRILFCLGLCRSHLPNHPQAINDYQRALDAKYDKAEVFNNLGFSYAQSGSPQSLQQARHFLDEALARRPDLAIAYYNRAWVGFRQAPNAKERFRPVIESAMADIRQALAYGPATAGLHLDAVRIFALATRADAGLVTDALTYGKLAIQHGASRAEVKHALETFLSKPLLFLDLDEVLPAARGQGQPGRPPRLADPLMDLPPEARPAR